jgi:hypothetical protein
MRRSVLILLAALATVSFGLCSTSVWAQAPNRASGPSPSQAGGRTFHRPVTHMLGLASEQPWRVGAIKLLAPGIGWAATGHGILWTEDGGVNWKKIKVRALPDGEARKDVSGLYELFFRDPRQGWALLAGCSIDGSKKLNVGLDLLSTTDSGATWSRTQVTPPVVRHYGNPDGAPIQGCHGNFAFADSLHGWINITVRGVTMDSYWPFFW